MSEQTGQIRAESQQDADEVHAVIAAAFAEEGEKVAELWRDVRNGAYGAEGLVATDGDRIIGHVGLSSAWLDARRELIDIVVLSPLSVEPEYQRAGIGTALLEAAVAAALRRTPVLVLEGDPGYYGARGFSAATEYGIERPSERIPVAACQVAVGADYQSWMSGRIVYPDVWWRHDAVGLRDPLLAQIEQAGA